MAKMGGAEMSLGIVPNFLRDAINEKLDKAYKEKPEAEIDRQYHYKALLEHFDEHGVIPDFSFGNNKPN